MKQYFGKYRGKVENNLDPMQLGRIQVSVAAVLGDGTLSWAMPCAPYAGPQVGFFAMPPMGANVWVEFEAGDPNKPIWTGCFWGVGEFPVVPPVPPGMGSVFLKTKTCTVTVNDLPAVGGITLEMTGGVKISMTALGTIEINNGKQAAIAMGPGPKITVNNGALEVLF